MGPEQTDLHRSHSPAARIQASFTKSCYSSHIDSTHLPGQQTEPEQVHLWRPPHGPATKFWRMTQPLDQIFNLEGSFSHNAAHLGPPLLLTLVPVAWPLES